MVLNAMVQKRISGFLSWEGQAGCGSADQRAIADHFFPQRLDLPTMGRRICRKYCWIELTVMTVERSRMRRVATPSASAYGRQMRRLLAMLWLALSLSVASGPASAVPAANCPMSASSQMQDKHDDMDCCAVTCASECAAICPAGVMPQLGFATTSAPAPRQDNARPADALESAARAGTDPPPRTSFR